MYISEVCNSLPPGLRMKVSSVAALVQGTAFGHDCHLVAFMLAETVPAGMKTKRERERDRDHTHEYKKYSTEYTHTHTRTARTF